MVLCAISLGLTATFNGLFAQDAVANNPPDAATESSGGFSHDQVEEMVRALRELAVEQKRISSAETRSAAANESASQNLLTLSRMSKREADEVKRLSEQLSQHFRESGRLSRKDRVPMAIAFGSMIFSIFVFLKQWKREVQLALLAASQAQRDDAKAQLRTALRGEGVPLMEQQFTSERLEEIREAWRERMPESAMADFDRTFDEWAKATEGVQGAIEKLRKLA